MSPARWGLAEDVLPVPVPVPKPAVVVGFSGLYDLAGFVARPPAGYAHLREAYRAFTAGAFGPDEAVWRADTLVPYQQLEAMRARLEGEEAVEVRVMEAGGDHDEIWQEGGRMAEVLWEVAGAL
ncbi:017d03b9-290c-4263-934f-cc60e58d5713 [Thermothielavioides terrestris]|uniref:017d03b9-290c-4263-934f-cc60e58d5713 n=1 Tax=Thermothielavioides terrestris TaxID=2587410 RepID=A0A3S4AVQ6_9PEZI|nr:017d03b9-290c-4263-934f-cc60e58d5713 [Thermothielavioides terrestris]